MVSGGTRQGGVATDGGNPGGGCRCNTNHRQGATTDGGNLVTRLMFAPDDELWFRLRVWHGNEGTRCVPWWQTRQRFGRISILLLPREWSCGQSVVRSTPPCWRSAMIEASARWGSSRAQRVPSTRHPWGCGRLWRWPCANRRGGVQPVPSRIPCRSRSGWRWRRACSRFRYRERYRLSGRRDASSSGGHRVPRDAQQLPLTLPLNWLPRGNGLLWWRRIRTGTARSRGCWGYRLITADLPRHIGGLSNWLR